MIENRNSRTAAGGNEFDAIQEYGSVLSIGIADFGGINSSDEPRCLQEVNQIIAATSAYQRARDAGQVVAIQGDEGISLVFYGDLTIPVRCAREVSKLARERTPLRLRMGIHAGTVYRYQDISGNGSVTGEGVRLAARIMSLGASGQILASEEVAKNLRQHRVFADDIRDLGPRTDAGLSLHLFSVDPGPIGNRGAGPAARPFGSPAAESRPHERAKTRVLAISYATDPRRGREQLTYAPFKSLDDDGAKPQVDVPVSSAKFEGHERAFWRKVDELTLLARENKPRENVDIIPAARQLARDILPPHGLAAMVGLDASVQLQVLQKLAFRIPWEVFHETYPECETCGMTLSPSFGEPEERKYCHKGHALSLRGGKLAIEFGLSFAVTGEQPIGVGGRNFWIFADPGEDLFTKSNDPSGALAQHIDSIAAILKEMGFEPVIRRGSFATAEELLAALADDKAQGIYYFGHGRTESGEGSLVLHDRPLDAHSIAEASTATRFLFLNACWAAAQGPQSDTDDNRKSVAAALAQEGDWKTVIAALCPIPAVQAAESALAFFEAARGFCPLRDAMREMRSKSYEMYARGEAHLSWFIYRLFGDPSRPLPFPKLDEGESSAVADLIGTLFDGEFRLNSGVFGFPIDDILIIAHERRKRHKRLRITLGDLAAGLLERGDLTRFLAIGFLAHPNELARRLETSQSSSWDLVDSPHQPAAEGEQRAGSPLELRYFERSVLALLKAADAASQKRPQGGRRISEQVVLEQLLADSTWDLLFGDRLAARDVLDWMHVVAHRGAVDENGCLTLKDLAPEARKVVDAALRLARQLGVKPITYRLMLAAFVEDERGYAAACCRQAPCCKERDIESSELFELMLATATLGGEPELAGPQNFGLSPEICGRAVTPVIEAARLISSSWDGVTEAKLFRTFCARADPAFKAWLSSSFDIDLDEIGRQRPKREPTLRPSQSIAGPPWMRRLDSGAATIVIRAHELAQKLGAQRVPLSLLLAAFFDGDERFAVESVLSRVRALGAADRISEVAAFLRDKLIRPFALPERESRFFPLDDAAAFASITPIVEKAIALAGKEVVDERTLFRAFCAAAPGEVKRALGEPGWFLDLDELYAIASGEPGAPVEAPEVIAPHPPAPMASAPPPVRTTAGTADIRLPAGIAPTSMDQAFWDCLCEAGDLARRQGWLDIRSPHLFAAAVARGCNIPGLGALGREARQALRDAALLITSSSLVPAASGTVGLSRNATQAIQGALLHAARAGRSTAGLEDLVLTLVEGAGPIPELIQGLRLQLGVATGQLFPIKGNKDSN